MPWMVEEGVELRLSSAVAVFLPAAALHYRLEGEEQGSAWACRCHYAAQLHRPMLRRGAWVVCVAVV